MRTADVVRTIGERACLRKSPGQDADAGTWNAVWRGGLNERGLSTMRNKLDSVRTIDDLRAYVHASLCDRENLLAEQFQTRIYELRQRGTACGLQFHLQGPRSVKLSAIWTTQQNVVYFYDAQGERFGKVRLTHRLYVSPSVA